MDTEKIGSFIAVRRKVCGLTQQQLADELGITNKAVSKWETGQGMPDVTLLPVLADILGVTADELLGGEKTENRESREDNLFEVSKAVFWFRAAAALSIFFALAGAVVPYFMLRETSAIGGMLFGCWWEACSAALFLTLFLRMKSVVCDHNKGALKKLDPIKIRNSYMRFTLWLWLFVPAGLLVQLLFKAISYDNLPVAALIALALTAAGGILIGRKFMNNAQA